MSFLFSEFGKMKHKNVCFLFMPLIKLKESRRRIEMVSIIQCNGKLIEVDCSGVKPHSAFQPLPHL